MWTRVYLFLVLVRLYFALSPSYIHPDENFQGPEVIAGSIFGFHSHLTWEFTSTHPVRSVFPLWPIYGLPMVVLRWLWTGTSNLSVPPRAVYYTLRGIMFVLSFVLEDWAIYELVERPRQRRLAVMLVASSYVTWTYQTHTFSNSVETIAVLWSLVLIQRIHANKEHSSLLASSLLAFFIVFGTFNRITFPAFLFLPAISLLRHCIRKPLTLLTLALAGSFTLLIAIEVDTAFFRPSTSPFNTLLQSPVLAPYNALIYNLSPKNLATHGLHPHYQHALVNTPLLMAPVMPLLLRPVFSSLVVSATSGLIMLSLLPHQEPRFLLPLIPLLLSSVRLPSSKRSRRLFIVSWVAFNTVMGVLMGAFHQAGVVPMQLHLGNDARLPHGSRALWWRTYSPPVWMADSPPESLRTVDLMGMKSAEVWDQIHAEVGSCDEKGAKGDLVLVAPDSAGELEEWKGEESSDGSNTWLGKNDLQWERIWRTRRHVGLDDLDPGGDGVWGTLKKVIGGRGLSAWRIQRRC